MFFSDDSNNFRNTQYLNEMNTQYLAMFRAYHKYIAYRNKLRNELTMSNEQKKAMSIIDAKLKKNLKRAALRVEKEDFI